MGNYISFKKEFGLILVGAIIFTASYLWKDLLLEIEEKYFPKGYGLMWRSIYTILVTVILVLVAIHLKNQFGLVNKDSKDPKDKSIEFDDSPIRDGSSGTPDNSNEPTDLSVETS
ncbi:hypothetical protein [Acanthamoeba castellanii mimivirus]|jgi:hypothetical protein|uniref:Uncharacterized protein L682 n=4 Tax=Mimivirus TaxID=315393 RepID=YL682_MIMIV|nr:hypothetical protein MIMI_gp0736 [Acanthamoeba polyphaga mimivirus]Q5UNU7.1 RecName: Full=Uncharacterized protein L682 [Acanthamoeba polyphaga mimivirus]AEQ60890.1 hypothetical protein [Acanthamoeba castellanii mamavirus]AHA45155.1 hypothetical protein HIRU_S249 [Hirudovirus strain Sangsue]ALR84272.1 hypothetical protein [Niemeyer virus]AMZ03125.1 hypothetical protein [Mimivirus Bombay]EJN41091.1 hypothetical protein lvs_L588 [Acanthamoeba polyphaga lentillevirus]QTF49618.1 hypothetical p